MVRQPAVNRSFRRFDSFRFEDCVHNVATCCWIAANIVWMVGEFYFDDGTRAQARLLFWAGLLVLGGWHAATAARRWLRWRLR